MERESLPLEENMPRPVIAFDYDGTLIDSYAIKRESYWRAVAEVLNLRDSDRPLVDASYARTSGAHRFEQLADTTVSLGRTVTEAQREDFSRRYSAYNDAAKGQMQEFPSVRSVLERLRSRFELVLVSGLPGPDLIADATRRGLTPFFAHIEGGDKGLALDRLKGQGREVMMLVGDTPHDQAVAASRQVPFFLVRGDDDLARLPRVLQGTARRPPPGARPRSPRR